MLKVGWPGGGANSSLATREGRMVVGEGGGVARWQLGGCVRW